MHTYDAQLTTDTAESIPQEAALDGAEEFLLTCCATATPWPHAPAVVDCHATEGRSWRLHLGPDGARAERLTAPAATPADASARAGAVRGR